MSRFGLDYGGYLPASAHKAVGSTFACRYLRELGGGEVNELIGAGIDVVLIYERDALRPLRGFDQGVFDAKEGLRAGERTWLPCLRSHLLHGRLRRDARASADSR